MDLTWSRFLSSFHKTGTSSNALAACTDHCGWRGGQGSISNCRDLLLMHWTRLLLSLHHRPHLHFPPLLSSSSSDCCSLSQALTFNHRKSVAPSLAGKKKKPEQIILFFLLKGSDGAQCARHTGQHGLFFVWLLPLWQHRAGVCVCAFLPQQQPPLRSPIRLAVMMLLLLSPLDAMGKADCLQCKRGFAGREGCNVAALSSLQIGRAHV